MSILSRLTWRKEGGGQGGREDGDLYPADPAPVDVRQDLVLPDTGRPLLGVCHLVAEEGGGGRGGV